MKVLEDGTNTCSEDMDFLLVGFRVSGVLTLPTGCQAPPSSLTLNLLDANSSMVVASSTVTTSGEYAFVGVSPGLYVLSPSGGGLFPSNTVEVVWGPVTVPPLQIPGFQLTGSVVGYHSEPLVGIAVHLIGKANPAPCAALQPPRDPSKHSCTDVTDSTGSFAFHSLSCDPFTLTAELTVRVPV